MRSHHEGMRDLLEESYTSVPGSNLKVGGKVSSPSLYPCTAVRLLKGIEELRSEALLDEC